jgi:hypothetical protein
MRIVVWHTVLGGIESMSAMLRTRG